jgi:hypothetical protein
MRLGDIWRTFALCLALSAAAHAAEPEVEQAIEHASKRGELIFKLDQSAWVSTDELRRKVPDLAKSGIQGWVIDPAGDRMLAIYYRLEGGEPRAAFIAETRGDNVLTSHVLGDHEDRRLTPIQIRMARAAQVARRLPLERCTDGPINSVIIPPTSPDAPVTVYMLSPRVKTDEFPFGGHQRFDIDMEGKVVARRAFSKACLNMTPPPAPDGGEPAVAIVTHLLDPTPTEIHVFTSISMGRPIVVGTNADQPSSETFRMWLVDGPKISFVDVAKDAAN